MVIGVTVFFGLAGIVGCYFFLKKEKRILFVEDNKVNWIFMLLIIIFDLVFGGTIVDDQTVRWR